jgi:hypothetical protein
VRKTIPQGKMEGISTSKSFPSLRVFRDVSWAFFRQWVLFRGHGWRRREVVKDIYVDRFFCIFRNDSFDNGDKFHTFLLFEVREYF